MHLPHHTRPPWWRHLKVISKFITVLTFIALPTSLKAEPAERPNIVFILADDLGYGELGCYGQEKIRTPNIDRLAAEGIRFTQHYTGAPVCAPARCTLLTGQNLSHAEVRNNRDSGNGRVFPGQFPITESIVTIGEWLQDAGYRTGAFGKWGLGPSNSSGSPIKQGFHRFFGYNCQRNAHSFFPTFLDSNEREQKINSGLVYGNQRKPSGAVVADDYRLANYAPDVILDEALQFIEANQNRPFFAYLPFVEPHVAMHPPQEWVDRYPEQWDEEKGAYRGQNGYLPHPRPRAGYAAMISDLDEHVGTVVQKLRQLNLTDRTLIIFTSDNGTTHPARDPAFHVGGVDAPFFHSTAGLRGWKGSVYEGGIRIPCVAKWPGKIPPGAVTDFASYFPDWFATLASVAGKPVPQSKQISKQQRLDGVDLMGVLQGQDNGPRPGTMTWEFHGYGGQIAIREGDWKAVRQNVRRKQLGKWELYDLAKDRGEKNDVAAAHPELIAKLESDYIANRTTEPDFPLPHYDSVLQTD